MRPRRLECRDEPAIEELLEQDPVINLFLLGFLAVHPVDRVWWYGIDQGERLAGIVLVLPGRLAVPYCPSDIHADQLGKTLRALHQPCMLVGPREACDSIWRLWGPGADVLRHYDQRLYTLQETPEGNRPEGFRRAIDADLEQVAAHAGAMSMEDLGVDPRDESENAHTQTVKDRIRTGRTWVLQQEGTILFQVNVGTTSHRGCQIGGTYVPPEARGHGHGYLGVRSAVQQILRRYPMVTLHVNEQNLAAVRVYEKVGFVRQSAMRLITVREAS